MITKFIVFSWFAYCGLIFAKFSLVLFVALPVLD
jgi:hypothetical protein